MLLNCGTGENSWESLGLQGDPTSPKGNQSWIFIGKTDAEAPIFWPPDEKNWLIGKDRDAGEDGRQEETGTTEDESVMPSNCLNLCRLLLWPSIFPSIRVFSNELSLWIRWPKYWRFSISPSNKYSRLISFRIVWFDLLVIQGTLKSLLQHHSSKAPILWRSAFFMIQLSHAYMTTGETIAWTIQTFVGKVISLLFKMLSRFVTAFLPRSKRL